MACHTDETICALATAAGGAPRGMVRVSGPTAIAIAAQLFEAVDSRPINTTPYAAALPGRVRIVLDTTTRFLPCDLFLWPTNRSYTREPVAEFHTISSPPLLACLLAAVCRAGARLAEPGEFTLRAFLAGRLDLTQAEAVLGVIDARGVEDLDTALAQLAGGLARPLHQLREQLLQLLADLEASLDFVDEDIELVSPGDVLVRLRSTGNILSHVAKQMASRHIASDAMQIVLVGPPNVGKSSLFNALVKLRGCAKGVVPSQSTPALVSPHRGTTRDYLIAKISLDGLQCELVDTAGVDSASLNPSSGDEQTKIATPSRNIGAAAQALAIERRKRATIRAYCSEASAVAACGMFADVTMSIDAPGCDVVVLTKSDLAHSPPAILTKGSLPVILTSSRTAYGLDTLCEVFRSKLSRDAPPQPSVFVATTAERCRESIRLAETSLNAAAESVVNNGGYELVAVELRSALGELGKVVGAVYTDDLLDRIFSTFCIGK